MNFKYFIFTIIVLGLLNGYVRANGEPQKNELNPSELTPQVQNTETTTTASTPTNNDESRNYPHGNIRFEMVGDSSHLFEPEDFQKVEVKPLRADESNNQAENDLDHLLFDDDDLKKADTVDMQQQPDDLNESTIQSDNNTNTQLNDTNVVNNKNKSSIECNIKNITNETLNYENRVKLVNGSALTEVLAESKTNDCFVVMFYVPWCPFSANLAPYYNALPRAFKYLDIFAFDVSKSVGYNTKFGTNAVPMVLIFQQKNVIAKFNHTQKNLTDLVEFVSKNTGIPGNNSITETADDLIGPVPTVPIKRFNYALLLSWIFLIFVALKFLFQKFNCYGYLKRMFLRLFYAQHEHND